MQQRRSLSPSSSRTYALRDALRRAQLVGPVSPLVASLATGLVASVVADVPLRSALDAPWRQLADTAAFVAAAAVAWAVLQRREVGAAIDVMVWLNGWETERWEREIGRRLPALPRSRPQMLDQLPDTLGLRPLRVELLAARGDLAAARERWELLPDDTPWQRFERAALAEWIAWWEDEADRIDVMELRLDELDDPERTVVARAMVAAARARRAAVSGEDAIRPLAAVRPLLEDRPRRYAFSTRAGGLVSVLIVGVVAAAVALIAAALSR